ncbi:phage tail domain-containing protein [Brevibacillus laterosporus]|uniref:phage tail domain-containing protein n=1 Tax=Brevibacillus laterosporus TaxID=1465 RepID=UPI00215BFC3A|nr:phage tail domain-containing protein [Brevibacillus laterosporus]MCR8994658.1 phage tail family protein [Brevibacillus laterosporus]
MLEGVNFYYDGIYSVDMGVINCQIDGGMFEEAFLPSRKIEEVSVNGRDKPYFQNVGLEPLEFEMTFAFEFGYDEKRLREVARWLHQDYYKPFYTIDNPNRIFYVMAEGDSKLVHNGGKQGYITLKMRCDSAYSYTPKFTKENMKFESTKLTKTIVENTFSNGMGQMENIEIVGNQLTVKKYATTWYAFAGKEWGDL